MAQDDGLEVAPDNDKLFTKSGTELPDPKVTIDVDIRAAFTTGEFKDFSNTARIERFGAIGNPRMGHGWGQLLG